MERPQQVCKGPGRLAIEEPNHRHRLLHFGVAALAARFARQRGARRERPRRGRAADERNELAPLHSITSSASNCTAFGTFRPRALAVFMLSTRSNLVGCRTGKSAGFAPRSIRPT